MARALRSSEKNKEDRQQFLTYLNSEGLGESLALTENNVISFHWSNWFRTCNYIKDQLTKSAKNKKRLHQLEEEINELKKSPIFMKNREKSLKASLYDLYESYLDNRLRITWFDRKEETLVSDHNESGPYVTLTSMRWYDKEIFANFVRKKILTQKIPCRSLRISTEIPLKVQYNKSNLGGHGMSLHQLTREGMIFGFNGENCLSKLESCETIDFSLPLEPFIKTMGWDYSKTMNHFSKINFVSYPEQMKMNASIRASVLDRYGNRKNIMASNKSDFYIFVPYSEIECHNPGNDLGKVFGSFVTKIEDFFIGSMKSKTAA